MRPIAVVLAALLVLQARADDAPHWAEYFKVFAAVRNETQQAIIAEADAALAPIGFHRDSTDAGYADGSPPGIFVSYSASGSAKALIIQGASPECLAFSAANYDRDQVGLVERAGAAIKAHFRAAFGSNVAFYSDAKCRVAL